MSQESDDASSDLLRGAVPASGSAGPMAADSPTSPVAPAAPGSSTSAPGPGSSRASAAPRVPIGFTSPASSASTGTPSRYRIRLRVIPVTRSPGVMMPVRLSGSAPPTAISARRLSSRRIDRSWPTASGRANCSPDMPATKRPPRISPLRLQSAIDHEEVAPGRCTGLPGQEALEDDAVAAEQSSWQYEHRSRRLSGRRPPVRSARSAATTVPRVSIPTGAVRYRRVAPLSGFRLLEGVISARRPAKLSEVTRPSPASSPSACSTWVGSSPEHGGQLVEERRAPLLQACSHRSGIAGELDTRLRSASASQSASMLPEEQRDRRRPNRTGCSARPPVRLSACPPPRHPSHHAEGVQQGGIVLRHPGREHIALPRGGRKLEAVQLSDDRGQPFEPAGVLVRIDPLPGEQEAHEVSRADRLDLGPEPVEGVAVDAREQPAVAPLEGGRSAVAGAELAAEDHALALERRQRDVGIGLADIERCGQLTRRGRPDDAEPSSKQLTNSILP